MSAQDSPENQLAVRLPWQEQQWQNMEALHNASRMPHALLFSGVRGVGKYRCAMAFAHFLLCERPVDGSACGECRQCNLNRAATHPDLKLVTPEEKGKQIKVDQVRELVGFLGHTSQQGGYKVALIQPADAMNINAANALLKSLEEPAGNTLLVLITDSPSRLLPTVRSRCRAVAFPLPELAQSLEWLTPVAGSPDQASELLSEAQGQPLTAVALLHSNGLGQLQKMDADYLAMLDGKVGPLTIAERWQEYELAEVLAWLSQRMSALIAACVADGIVNNHWQALIKRSSSQRLYGLLDRVNLLSQQLRQGSNPNKQLALEELMLISCDKFHS